MKSYCTKCNRQTNQLVVKEVNQDYFEEESGWWDKSEFQIIQCMGCDDISFRKLYNDISQQQHSDEDGTTQELFPQRGAHSRPIRPFRGLPFTIRTIYRETIDAYNANLTLLCGVGVRAVVEAICIEKSIISVKTKTGGERNSKNLDGKIAGLATKGFLTVDNAEVLHELRFLGNEAVHDLTQPSIEELGLAIDIIELIIENIYMMRSKALSLQAKREIRKK
jgi:hypothetical protein